MTDPTIQSPAGPPAAATGSWLVSLAEVDAMGRKAAQGAGFSWGMAEEAGRAARWLAAYGLPGPEALAAVLKEVDGAVARYAPGERGTSWTSSAGRLCPIAVGAALSDRALEIVRGARFDVGPVISPLLVVPFLARAARDLDCQISMTAPAFRCVSTPQGPACDNWDKLRSACDVTLSVALSAAPPCAPLRAGSAAHSVEVDLWRGLDAFAQRTYAPSSEESRRAGAGAGLHDYD